MVHAGKPAQTALDLTSKNANSVGPMADEQAPSIHDGASGAVSATLDPSVKKAATNQVSEQRELDSTTATNTTAPEQVAAAAATDEVEAQVASNTASETSDAEPTGAIPDGDRQISATEIREQQTAEATSGQSASPATPASTEEDKVAALPPAAKDGKFLVQIASYRQKDDALRRFDTLSNQHGDLFSELSPDILRADLGERGIYYRLRIGPFQSFESSTDLCNALKARKLDCLVIRRKSAG